MFLEELNSLNIHPGKNEAVVIWNDPSIDKPEFGFDASIEVVQQPSLKYTRHRPFVFEIISEN